MTSLTWRWSLAIALVGTPAVSISSAAADPASGAHSCDNPSLRGLVVDVRPGGPEAPIVVPVHPAVMTKVHLGPKLTNIRTAKLDGIAWGLTPSGILIEAGGAPIGKDTPSRGVITAATQDGSIKFALRAVDEPDQAYATLIVERREARASGKPAMMVLGRVCAPSADALGDDARTVKRLTRSGQAGHETDVVSAAPSGEFAFLESAGVRAIDFLDSVQQVQIDDPNPAQLGVNLRASHWIWSPKHKPRMLRYVITNPTERTYRPAWVQIQREDGSPVPAPLTEAWINGVRVDRGEPIEIPPGEHVDGLIWVLKPEVLGAFATLAIGEEDGNPRVHEKIPAKVEFIEFNPPLTPEEREQKQRDREAKRGAVYVRPLFGISWLNSGLDPAELAATSIKGLAIGVTKGLASWNESRYSIAIEAEVSGASSGTAEFRDVEFGGAQGDLMRSARLGRAQFNVLARLGEKVIPTLKFGFGLQAGSHDAVLMTPGGPMDGPDSAIEFIASFNFGAGIDVVLGEHVIVGVGFVFAQPADSELYKRGVELGLHASYAWQP